MNDERERRADPAPGSGVGRAVVEGLAEAGVEAAGGGVRVAFAVAALAAGALVFAGLGRATDLWSPAAGLATVGAFALVGLATWRRARYLVAAAAGLGGALAVALVGTGDLVGFAVLGSAVLVAAAALLWGLIEELLTL